MEKSQTKTAHFWTVFVWLPLIDELSNEEEFVFLENI